MSISFKNTKYHTFSPSGTTKDKDTDNERFNLEKSVSFSIVFKSNLT